MYKILPVFIPFGGCNCDCIYCNQNKISGISSGNLLKQSEEQIEYYLNISKYWDEIGFFGGSFSCLPSSLRENFYEIARKTAIKTLRFSTRPDCINSEIIPELKVNNVKTVELGVQSFSDDVLSKNNRPYLAETAENALYLLKNKGISSVAQIMVGMYAEEEEDFIKTVDRLCIIRPSAVRIYPNVVIKDTLLEKLYLQKEFTPLSFLETLLRTSYAVMKFVSNGMDILRVGLQYSRELKESIVGGFYHESFGDMVKAFIIACYIDRFGKITLPPQNIQSVIGYKGLVKKMFYDRIQTDESVEFSFKNICSALGSSLDEDYWGGAQREIARFAQKEWCQTHH